MMLTRTLLVAGLLVSTMPSLADEKILQRAESAANAGNFAITYCLLLPLAKNGYAEAQNRIGWLYHLGNGLAIDDEQAIYWWEQAAGKGHLEATMALADLYHQGGKGVRTNDKKALHYLFAAARGGEEDARLLIASYFTRKTSPEIREAGARMIKEAPELLGEPLRIRVKKANLRTGPGTGHAVAGSLLQGETVFELARQGKWILIMLRSEPWMAWVFASLTEPAPANPETPATP